MAPFSRKVSPSELPCPVGCTEVHREDTAGGVAVGVGGPGGAGPHPLALVETFL